MNPFLHFHSALDSGTLSASSEAGGYPKENVRYWRWAAGYAWRAGAVTSPQYLQVDLGAGQSQAADTLIVAGHNLRSCGATALKARYSSNGADWSDAGSVDPSTGSWADDWPVWLRFASQAARYWRVEISRGVNFAAAPYLAIATLGTRLEFLHLPVTFPQYGERPQTDWTKNQDGVPLGANFRSLARPGVSIEIDEPGYLDSEFYKKATGKNWDDHGAQHARSRPLWIAGNLDLDWRPLWLATVLGWDSPFVSLNNRRTLRLDCDLYLPARNV